MNNQNQLKILSFSILIFILISFTAMDYWGGFTGGNSYKINNYFVFVENPDSVEEMDWHKTDKKIFLSKVDVGFFSQEIFVQIDLDEYPGNEEIIYLELNNPSCPSIAVQTLKSFLKLALKELRLLSSSSM